MLEIPLSALPRQSFSIQLGQNLYDIAISACQDIMAVDIVKNGVAIVSGQRAVAGYPIIPYEYLEDGNFLILTANEDYPDYTEFGITQTLMYITQTELATLRAGL